MKLTFVLQALRTGFFVSFEQCKVSFGYGW